VQPPPLRVSAGLQSVYAVARHARISSRPRQDLEAVGIGPRRNMVVVAAEAAVKLVEDAVVLVQLAQLHGQIVISQSKLSRMTGWSYLPRCTKRRKNSQADPSWQSQHLGQCSTRC
jgi:hypothetical protein